MDKESLLVKIEEMRLSAEETKKSHEKHSCEAATENDQNQHWGLANFYGGKQDGIKDVQNLIKET